MIRAGIFLLFIIIKLTWAFFGKNLAPKPKIDSTSNFLGNDVFFGTYSGNGKNFSCNFDNPCCWSNSQAQSGQTPWQVASGRPDSIKFQSAFGTTNVPSGRFLTAVSSSSESSGKDKTTIFSSCAIGCADVISLSLRHWQGSKIKIKVCELDESEKNRPMQNCQELPSSNGHTDTVSLPGGKNVKIAIMAEGLVQPSSTGAIIDDLKVEFEPCYNTTSTWSSTEVTPVPTISKSEAAQSKKSSCPADLTCDFEKNTLCRFSAGNGEKNWEVTEAPFKNPHTGIKKSDQGRYFAAAYLKLDEIATLTSGDSDTSLSSLSIQFDWYRSTQGIDLAVCCDDIQKCNWTTKEINVDDYRMWRTDKATCPDGTRKILFRAKNNGKNQGAVGLDDIRISSISQSAC